MGCVYFAKRASESVFKIGSTRCLPNRIRAHSTTDPTLSMHRTIDVEDHGRCETHLHKYFEHLRVPGTREFFGLTPEQLEEADASARWFHSEFVPMEKAAAQFSNQASQPSIIQPAAREKEIYRELREVREKEYRLALRREFLENELKVVIGTAAGLDGIARWGSHVRKRFDQPQFKLDSPSVYAEYLREKVIRMFRLS